MTRSTDSLTKAIAYLGAVEVAPGRYAFRISGQNWFVSTTNALEYYFAGFASDGERLEYLQARCETARMPIWWTPDQRFAWRSIVDGSFWKDPGNDTNVRERIAADLETGAEVPA